MSTCMRRTEMKERYVALLEALRAASGGASRGDDATPMLMDADAGGVSADGDASPAAGAAAPPSGLRQSLDTLHKGFVSEYTTLYYGAGPSRYTARPAHTWDGTARPPQTDTQVLGARCFPCACAEVWTVPSI